MVVKGHSGQYCPLVSLFEVDDTDFSPSHRCELRAACRGAGMTLSTMVNLCTAGDGERERAACAQYSRANDAVSDSAGTMPKRCSYSPPEVRVYFCKKMTMVIFRPAALPSVRLLHTAILHDKGIRVAVDRAVSCRRAGWIMVHGCVKEIIIGTSDPQERHHASFLLFFDLPSGARSDHLGSHRKRRLIS